MTTTAEHLQQFYVELQAWIEAGMPESEAFYPRFGLCSNLTDWARTKGIASRRLRDDLTASFEAAGLDPEYPFDGDGDRYSLGNDEHGHRYANPARLAWIKARAAGEPITNPSNDIESELEARGLQGV